MTVFTEIFLLTGLIAAFYSLDLNLNVLLNDDDYEDSVPDTREDFPEKYENTKSLYDLIAHFPVDKNIKCPESDTRLPYPGDCNRYVTCRDFNAHIRSCPPGFKFDKESLHCRFGSQVDCNDTADSNHLCGENEFYSECGPMCEASCEISDYDYIDCTEKCAKGCFCKEGFIRGSLRMCVLPGQCRSNNRLEHWFLTNSQMNVKEADPPDADF